MSSREDFQYVNMSTAEDAEGYYAEKGNWVVANVRQAIGWTDKKIIVNFRDIRILLLPEEKDNYCAAAILCKNGISQEKARTLLNHFFSSLSWSCQQYIDVEYWSGGGRPYVMGKGKEVRMLSKPFRIWYLPDPTDAAARLALAFYREGLSLRDSAYGFLSFFKIINLKCRTGSQQKDWIEKQLPNIDKHDAKERLTELRNQHGSDLKIAEYLYHSCRCALAHADINDTTVNPEDYEDTSRLIRDLPLIKALAEIMIEQEFKVLRQGTIYKRRPYELFGFKQLFDKNFIEKVIAGEEIKEITFLQVLSLRLWGEQTCKPLERMKVVGLETRKGQVIVQLLSENEKIQVMFALDFANDKILFHPVQSVLYIKDDGTADYIEDMIAVSKFLRRYWANGILEIWDSNMNKCLGFSNPFVPVNIDLSRTLKNFDDEISGLETEFEKRRNENDPPPINKAS